MLEGPAPTLQEPFQPEQGADELRRGARFSQVRCFNHLWRIAMKTRIPALILAAGAAFTTAAFAQTQAPADAAYVQPLTQDQLIKREVIDRIAADDHLSGRVGVEI